MSQKENYMWRSLVPSVLAFVLAGAAIFSAAAAPRGGAQSDGPVAVGDIVRIGINGNPTIGEVMRVAGATADLNLGQNNISMFAQIEYMTVLQRVGRVPRAAFNSGDVVAVPYIADTVLQGAIMKVNGAYCEIDASASGFTGWNLCAELRVIRRAPPPAMLSVASGLAAAGSANPLAGKAFFLLKESLERVLATVGLRPTPGQTAGAALQIACKSQPQSCQQAAAAVAAASITAVVFDASGKGTLPEGVPSGAYYLFGSIPYDGKLLIWDLRLDLKPGANAIALSQTNAIAINP